MTDPPTSEIGALPAIKCIRGSEAAYGQNRSLGRVLNGNVGPLITLEYRLVSPVHWTVHSDVLQKPST